MGAGGGTFRGGMLGAASPGTCGVLVVASSESLFFGDDFSANGSKSEGSFSKGLVSGAGGGGTTN